MPCWVNDRELWTTSTLTLVTPNRHQPPHSGHPPPTTPSQQPIDPPNSPSFSIHHPPSAYPPFSSNNNPSRAQSPAILAMLDVLIPCVLLAILFLALRSAPSFAHRHTRRAARKLPAPAVYRLGLGPRSEWSLERNGWTLSTSTAALNALPKRAIARLTQRGRGATRRFYDAGVLAGGLGGAGALIGALWALARAWIAVWDEAEAHARQGASITVSRVLKRAIAARPPEVHTSNPGLVPLVSPQGPRSWLILDTRYHYPALTPPHPRSRARASSASPRGGARARRGH